MPSRLHQANTYTDDAFFYYSARRMMHANVLESEIHRELTYEAARPLKMTKYDQKIKVEKTPDFVLSRPMQSTGNFFLKCTGGRE